MASASEQLNYAGANKIYSHLKNDGQRVNYKAVEAYVERQPYRQVFAQPRRLRHPKAKGPTMLKPPNLREGRVPAIDLNDRWMADLADLTAQPSIPAEGVNRGHVPYQYILVVVNVFSKELFARPLQYKTPETVLAAFREILHGQHKPSRLDTDGGAEFSGPFAAFLDAQHIWHVVKDPEDPNTYVKLTVYRRGTDERLFKWYTPLFEWADTQDMDVVDQLMDQTQARYPLRDEEIDIHLVMSHKWRVKINRAENKKLASRQERTLFLKSPGEMPGVMMQPQDMHIWDGMELLCQRRKYMDKAP